MEKDYRVIRKRQHLHINDRHKGLLQSDGHFLIQPVCYLQYGRAAHPAEFEFRTGSLARRLRLSTQLADAVSVLGQSSSPFQHLYLTVVT